MMAIIDNLQITLPCSVAAMKIVIMWLRKEGKNAITIAATANSLRGTLNINHVLKIDLKKKQQFTGAFCFIVRARTDRQHGRG